MPWPAVTTLAPRFGPCRASEEERGPDRTAVKPCNPWQPDPAYGAAAGAVNAAAAGAAGEMLAGDLPAARLSCRGPTAASRVAGLGAGVPRPWTPRSSRGVTERVGVNGLAR